MEINLVQDTLQAIGFQYERILTGENYLGIGSNMVIQIGLNHDLDLDKLNRLNKRYRVKNIKPEMNGLFIEIGVKP